MGSAQMEFELERKFQWGRQAKVNKILWMTGVSVVLAGLTAGIARWRQMPAKLSIVWVLLVLCFNLGGFVSFLVASDRVIVLACPSCGKRRRVDRSGCPSCGAEWERPAPSEREIMTHGDTGTGHP